MLSFHICTGICLGRKFSCHIAAKFFWKNGDSGSLATLPTFIHPVDEFGIIPPRHKLPLRGKVFLPYRIYAFDIPIAAGKPNEQEVVSKTLFQIIRVILQLALLLASPRLILDADSPVSAVH